MSASVSRASPVRLEFVSKPRTSLPRHSKPPPYFSSRLSPPGCRDPAGVSLSLLSRSRLRHGNERLNETPTLALRAALYHRWPQTGRVRSSLFATLSLGRAVTLSPDVDGHRLDTMSYLALRRLENFNGNACTATDPADYIDSRHRTSHCSPDSFGRSKKK